MKNSIKKRIAITAMVCALALSAGVAATVTATAREAETQTEQTLQVAVLKNGSKGGEVAEVQRRLKLWGYYNGAVDGVFGAGTKSAIIAFQKKNGLTADGVVGKSTYKALGMNSSYQALVNGSSSSSSSSS